MLLIYFRSAKWVPGRKIAWTVGCGTFWGKMTTLDLVLGRPLSSAEDKDERVGSFAGVSVFGLDALSSAAYGPEAALTILIPLGVAGQGLVFRSQSRWVHWLKSKDQGARLSTVINGLAALATGITFLIVMVTKF